MVATDEPGDWMEWVMVFMRLKGSGVMSVVPTSCGVPVYDKERFLGTIALDLTVDFLNSIVNAFHPDKGPDTQIDQCKSCTPYNHQ